MKRYMEGYDSYQRNENCTEQLAEKLMPNSILEKPWIHISADFITKLSLAQEYNAILVVVDWLTKMVHFIPTTEKTTAEGLAKCYESPKQEKVSHTFQHLVQNLKAYNRVITNGHLLICDWLI